MALSNLEYNAKINFLQSIILLIKLTLVLFFHLIGVIIAIGNPNDELQQMIERNENYTHVFIEYICYSLLTTKPQ